MVEQPEIGRELPRLLRGLHVEGEDGAEAVGHLGFQPRKVGGLEAGVGDFADDGFHDVGVGPGALERSVKPRGEVGCVGGLALDAQLEGAQTADAEPAFETAEDGSEEDALVAELRGHRLALGAFLHGEDAAEHVAVATDVLGPAVHDDVGAPGKGVLQAGGCKCRVDAEYRTPLMRAVCVLLDREGFARGIEGCLEVHNVAFSETGFVPCCIVGMQIYRLDAVHLLVDADHAVAAVIAAADGNDLGNDVDEEGVEGAEAGRVADDMVGELIEVFLWRAGVDEGGEDGLEAVDVGGGEARVDEGSLEVDYFAAQFRDGLEVCMVARVAECGGCVDRGCYLEVVRCCSGKGMHGDDGSPRVDRLHL